MRKATNRPGRKKNYKNIRFQGWTKSKSTIEESLEDPYIDTNELKRYVRYAISESEAAETKLREYREILEDLNRSTYSANDKDVALQRLKSTSLNQKDLHK